EALHETGEFDEAEIVLRGGIELEPPEALRLRLIVSGTTNLHGGVADVEAALQVTRNALEWPEWSDASRAELVADEASALVFSGHPSEEIAKVESGRSEGRRGRWG